MQVVIPTHRRMARQATLGFLPIEWIDGRRSTTHLVVDKHDAEVAKLYNTRGAQILVIPDDITTIAAKRAWIIRHFGELGQTIVMFDDDLRFAVRIEPRNGENKKLRQATPNDIADHLAALECLLESEETCTVHAGWSARQGNNTKRGDWEMNTRMMFVLGYDCKTLVELEKSGKIELGRINTREDMELTLQLLRLGYPNMVTSEIAADQVAGYDAVGGCREERSVASSDIDAMKLAELHPGFVTVVEKAYKGSVNRKEVIVYWKRAYESSKAATS